MSHNNENYPYSEGISQIISYTMEVHKILGKSFPLATIGLLPMLQSFSNETLTARQVITAEIYANSKLDHKLKIKQLCYDTI